MKMKNEPPLLYNLKLSLVPSILTYIILDAFMNFMCIGVIYSVENDVNIEGTRFNFELSPILIDLLASQNIELAFQRF